LILNCSILRESNEWTLHKVGVIKTVHGDLTIEN
jgi:hypothetical protein